MARSMLTAVPAAPAAPAVPAVSVVVPTYRRPTLLLRCLEGVARQSLPRSVFEVVVVDDGHDDATQQALLAWYASTENATLQLHYLRPPQGRGPAVARNAGWRAARGALIAFTDDDTLPQPDWLAEGLAAMTAQREWSAARGRVEVPLPREPNYRPTDHERMTQGLEDAEFVTANAFVRHAALQRIGGFDERFGRAWREDSDLQFRLMRQVGPVGRCDTAVVQHPARPERWGVCLRQQRNAYYEALLYREHPRLYRERIEARAPWRYYALVGATTVAVIGAASGRPGIALGAAAVGIGLIGHIAWRRLRRTSLAPRHVWEMIATSALIPFLSVYWRLRGAWRFRVVFW